MWFFLATFIYIYIMNIIRFISIIFLAFLFSKCTNYKEPEDFVLQFDLYSKSNDSIHIYYVETDSLDFSEKKSIWKKGMDTR